MLLSVLESAFDVRAAAACMRSDTLVITNKYQERISKECMEYLVDDVTYNIQLYT